MINEIDMLATEIASAAKKSFLTLFENKESYYYCVILTTGEGLSPFISAWSWQALHRISNKEDNPEEYAKLIKWSYADSPYYSFGLENFDTVQRLFLERPSINELDSNNWKKELNFRIKAMEIALSMLDKEGIFALTQPREDIYINVEMMPPDKTNTERALLFNKAENIEDWLEEAAEP